MQDATPLPRVGPLGNHRYLGKTPTAVAELIPTPKPDHWHVTVFGSGEILATDQPVAAAAVAGALTAGGIKPPIRWRKRWHRPTEGNPYLAMAGKVYAIRADNGLIKIGSSAEVPKRLAALRTFSPCALELQTTFDGGAPVEYELHRQLKPYRHHGEWFTPDPEVLAALDRCHTPHGLYDVASRAMPWEREEGPEPWEVPDKRQPDGVTATWALQVGKGRWLHVG